MGGNERPNDASRTTDHKLEVLHQVKAGGDHTQRAKQQLLANRLLGERLAGLSLEKPQQNEEAHCEL